MSHSNVFTHIIELKDAHNNILEAIPLKDEIDIVTGMFALAYIPVDGAKQLNGFREEGQFRPSVLTASFNRHDSICLVPLVFECLQGFVPGEEANFNFNKQVFFTPVPVYRKIEPNTSLKVKYRNSLCEHRFVYNIRLFLTYIDK